jgi:hypothetical protein
LALLVIVSVLPEAAKLALPETILGPAGLARASGVETAKQAATDTARRLGLIAALRALLPFMRTIVQSP